MADRLTGSRPRIALVRQGDRPRLNERLAGLLTEAFPDHEVDDIDVLAAVRASPLRSTAAAVAAAAEYGVPLARRTISAKRAIVRSAGFARLARRVVLDRVDPATHRFTFQSQSLFDASVPGVPHFVYTDHAHLANLGYPAFDPADLASTRHLRDETALYRAATAVFVRSEHVRATLVHGYGCHLDTVEVVGVGPNVAMAAPPDPRPWHGGRILFVGVDWRRKGGDVLLAAFHEVRRRHPSARLDVVGCDPADVAGDGVTVHGRLPPAEVARLAADADVFCLPTRIEPFGVAFIEAMHAGLPVVGTRLGAIPDFAIPGETGELVEPDDPDGLADVLAGMLEQPGRTIEMGARARALARARYDWDVVMHRIHDSIERRLRRIDR